MELFASPQWVTEQEGTPAELRVSLSHDQRRQAQTKWPINDAVPRPSPPAVGRWADEAVPPQRGGWAGAGRGVGGGAARGRHGGGSRSRRHRPKMAEYVQVLKRALKHLGGHGGVRGAIWQLLR